MYGIPFEIKEDKPLPPLKTDNYRWQVIWEYDDPDNYAAGNYYVEENNQ
jgi:hypothetical protein